MCVIRNIVFVGVLTILAPMSAQGCAFAERQCEWDLDGCPWRASEQSAL